MSVVASAQSDDCVSLSIEMRSTLAKFSAIFLALTSRLAFLIVDRQRMKMKIRPIYSIKHRAQCWIIIKTNQVDPELCGAKGLNDGPSRTGPGGGNLECAQEFQEAHNRQLRNTSRLKQIDNTSVQ